MEERRWVATRGVRSSPCSRISLQLSAGARLVIEARIGQSVFALTPATHISCIWTIASDDRLWGVPVAREVVLIDWHDWQTWSIDKTDC